MFLVNIRYASPELEAQGRELGRTLGLPVAFDRWLGDRVLPELHATMFANVERWSSCLPGVRVDGHHVGSQLLDEGRLMLLEIDRSARIAQRAKIDHAVISSIM